MTISVSRQREIAVPHDFAFSFISDYRNIPLWMYGISAIEPLGGRARGVGACFRAVFAGGAGATELELEAIRWQDGHLIALSSVRGPEVAARFQVAAVTESTTLVRVEIEVPAPGGLAGVALRTVTNAVAGRAIRHTEANLRRELEARYAGRQAPEEI
ncbi:SRPBCC family protein [Nocardia elegans]|uniref:SRPBCC family protein n=1 Tax=Nocardia elegans TaxID=300029 RepID=UPI0018935C30|nr:SRPBCC family protein [Nocardia elegans]MBF6245646.1 SRPBCC family protein [Nocardia elegans]